MSNANSAQEQFDLVRYHVIAGIGSQLLEKCQVERPAAWRSSTEDKHTFDNLSRKVLRYGMIQVRWPL